MKKHLENQVGCFERLGPLENSTSDEFDAHDKERHPESPPPPPPPWHPPRFTGSSELRPKEVILVLLSLMLLGTSLVLFYKKWKKNYRDINQIPYYSYLYKHHHHHQPPTIGAAVAKMPAANATRIGWAKASAAVAASRSITINLQRRANNNGPFWDPIKPPKHKVPESPQMEARNLSVDLPPKDLMVSMRCLDEGWLGNKLTASISSRKAEQNVVAFDQGMPGEKTIGSAAPPSPFCDPNADSAMDPENEPKSTTLRRHDGEDDALTKCSSTDRDFSPSFFLRSSATFCFGADKVTRQTIVGCDRRHQPLKTSRSNLEGCFWTRTPLSSEEETKLLLTFPREKPTLESVATAEPRSSSDESVERYIYDNGSQLLFHSVCTSV